MGPGEADDAVGQPAVLGSRRRVSVLCFALLTLSPSASALRSASPSPSLWPPLRTVVGQSRAITRLVGKGTGLYPSDDVLAALVDECMDGADDIMSITNREGQGLPLPEKIEKRQAACKEGGATYVAVKRVEALYERVGAPGPFLTGEVLDS